jgi:hypothetical protein
MRSALLAATLASALIAIGASHAATPPAQQAARLFERARQRVELHHPRCRPHARTVLSEAAPPAALLERFAVLRRPARADEALPPRSQPNGEIFVNWVRVVPGPEKLAFYVVPSRTATVVGGPPACARLRHRALSRLLDGEPATVRRRARRVERRFDRRARRRPRSTPAIALYAREPDGALGQQLHVVMLGRTTILDISFIAGVGRRRSLIARLVPDAVATGTAVLARRGSPRPSGRRPVYPSRVRLTQAPVENVLALIAPRPARDAWPRRMTYRAADGTVVATSPPSLDARSLWWPPPP